MLCELMDCASSCYNLVLEQEYILDWEHQAGNVSLYHKDKENNQSFIVVLNRSYDQRASKKESSDQLCPIL